MVFRTSRRTTLSWIWMLLGCLMSDVAMAAIAYVSGTSNSSSSAASTLSITLPTGTTTDDAMLAVVALRGNRTITAPSGWISVQHTNSSSGSNISQEVFVKVATASESASFTFSGSERCAMAILACRGVDISAPVDAVGGQANSSSSVNVSAPSITTTTANAQILGFFGIAHGSATFTPPSGMSARHTVAASAAGSNSVSILMADNNSASAGATGSKTAVASTASQSVGQMGALRPVGAIIACYSFEEASWNGTAGEVIDGRGTYNAVRLGSALTTASGNLSRGANFPYNTSTATKDAVQTPINIRSHVGNAGTITFWYKSNADWNNGVRRNLLDASIDSTSPQKSFYLEIDSSGDLKFGLHDSADNYYQFETVGYSSLTAGTWVHIAITWRLPNGVIDELRVYNTVRTSAQINADMTTASTCSSTIASYSIDVGAGTGSTCAVKSITFTALNSGGATYTGYTGTMNLSTATGTGDWTLVSGNGTLSNGSADDGAATYTFAAGDNGVVTPGLSHYLAQSVAVTAVDSVTSSTSTTSSAIAFGSNTFVFTEDLSSRIAGADVAVAGRAHDYQAALYRRDASTGS